MGRDPTLYSRHVQLQDQRVQLHRALDETAAKNTVVQAQLGMESERNMALQMRLNESGDTVIKTKQENERCLTQLLQCERECQRLREENATLHATTKNVHHQQGARALAAEHALKMENEKVKGLNVDLQAKLESAIDALKELQTANNRGGKQLWESDSQVQRLMQEKDALKKKLRVENEAKSNLLRQLEASQEAQERFRKERDATAGQIGPLRVLLDEAFDTDPFFPEP